MEGFLTEAHSADAAFLTVVGSLSCCIAIVEGTDLTVVGAEVFHAATACFTLRLLESAA